MTLHDVCLFYSFATFLFSIDFLISLKRSFKFIFLFSQHLSGMGIASTMEENMKKNMEAQMKFQKDLIVKQRQAQLAMQIGMAR